MPRRGLLALILLAIALEALTACGDSRVPAPRLSDVQAPGAMTTASYLSGNLHFDAPSTWATQLGAGPLVVTYASGPAIIAIWRYPRSPTQHLPDNLATLGQARSSLIAAATARDRSFRVLSSAVVDQGLVRGVELDALETIRGRLRRVRSAHLYTGGAELVIDEYAPPAMFHAVDRSVFSPLLHSLRLGGVGGA